MKHLITQMLMMIAPIIMSAESKPQLKFTAADFEIVASNQIFSANPSASDPTGGCQATVSLQATINGQSTCNISNLLHYNISIDLFGDGTVDMIASSDVDPQHKGVWYNDPADQVMKTYIQPSATGNYVLKLPDFVSPLSKIQHKIYWSVSDPCGSKSEQDATFSVIDKKAPTPYCVSLSAALFQTNPMIAELWAIYFDKGAFDNCTPQENLVFTFNNVRPIDNRINEEHFYKAGPNGSIPATSSEYSQGKAYKWLPSARSASLVFTACGTYNINISVWDSFWNTDYCTVVLDCGCIGLGQNNYILTNVKTVKYKPLENALVLVNANIIEFPKSYLTDKDGHAFTGGLSINTPYKVSSSYTDDSRKGVEYKDYYILNEHLKGTKKLDHYWQYIAADMNKDKKVDSQDLSLLKASIKGTEKPEWKLVVANDTLGAQNWTSYDDTFDTQSSTQDTFTANFVAIKLGDLDGNVCDDKEDIVDPKLQSPSVDTTMWRSSITSQTNVFTSTPNPFSEQTNVSFTLSKSQKIQMSIQDMHSNKITSSDVAGQEGINHISIQNLGKPGIYYCHFTGEFGHQIIKLIQVY